MPDLRSIQPANRGGKDGFEFTWKTTSFSRVSARTEAVGATVVKFPVLPRKVETVQITEVGKAVLPGRSDYIVVLFVPEMEVKRSGIENPVQRLRRKFESSKLDFR